jgi:hypothetical protein
MRKLAEDKAPSYVLSYPRWVRLSRQGLVILLLAAALVQWALAWLHFLLPVVLSLRSAAQASSPLGPALSDALAAQPLRPLIAAHMALPLAAAAVAIIYAFVPDLGLADGGLAVRTLRGWWLVPWDTIRMARIASFEKPKRRLVLLQGSWTRWAPWPRLVSLCLGAGFAPGLLLTAALRDFAPLMERLYREVRRAVPQAVFDAEFFSVPALLVVEPVSTLADLVEQAREEGWPLDISAQAMAAVSGGLVLVELLILLLSGGAWWKPIAIVGLGGMEWAIGTLYLYALAEIFPARVELRQAALLYPLPQIPRALLAVPMAMFVAAGLSFVAAMVGLVGVLWAVILTALLVQQLFRLESILPAVIGGVFQVLFQFLLLAFVLTW